MGVVLVNGDPWKRDIEEWHRLGGQEDAAAWGRAEIAERKYSEGKAPAFAKEVGCDDSYVYKLARTFRAFPEKWRRLHNLSFEHHRVAADSLSRVAREGIDAAMALAAEGDTNAEGEKVVWSTRTLRRYLFPTTDEEPTEPEPEPETCSVGTCGPATDAVKLLHVAGIIEKFYSVKDYEIEPLIAGCMKKDLRNQAKKIRAVSEWLERLQEAIRIELARQSTRTQEARNEA